MSGEKYGPPEREAQGRRVMERELTADAWREHKMQGRKGRGKSGGGVRWQREGN